MREPGKCKNEVHKNMTYYITDKAGNPIEGSGITMSCPDCGEKLSEVRPNEN